MASDDSCGERSVQNQEKTSGLTINDGHLGKI